VDAYHALNVVPFSLKNEGLERAYVVGGGYKYCQLGPGNAFLRFPTDTTLRPVVTGWFSEFTDLSQSPMSGRVGYGPGPARFAGATYDFTSHYRGAAVFKFFEKQRLTPKELRALSQRQVEALASALGIETEVALHEIGGFLALRTRDTERLCKTLREHGVWTDYRGDALRLGPAPYITEEQLDQAANILRGSVIASPRRTP
jgi:kynureninase